MTWRIWRILIRALKNFKNFLFNGLPLTKVYNLWGKNLQGSFMFDGTEYWCKIWRKTDSCFQKWHDKLFISALERLKIWTFMGFFYPNQKMYDNEKRCKIGRGIDLSFQNWHESFDFDQSTQKFQNFALKWAAFDQSIIMFELKNYRGVMFDGTYY